MATTRTEHVYTHTLIHFASDGEIVSRSLGQVIEGRVYRSNGLWTSNNGTERYHDEWVHSTMFLLRRFGGHVEAIPGKNAFMDALCGGSPAPVPGRGERILAA